VNVWTNSGERAREREGGRGTSESDNFRFLKSPLFRNRERGQASMSDIRGLVGA
jgi:hypothetical protein